MQPLEEYATSNSDLFAWRWLLSISTHQLSPVSTPVNGEVMKVDRPRLWPHAQWGQWALPKRIYKLLRFHKFSPSCRGQGLMWCCKIYFPPKIQNDKPFNSMVCPYSEIMKYLIIIIKTTFSSVVLYYLVNKECRQKHPL